MSQGINTIGPTAAAVHTRQRLRREWRLASAPIYPLPPPERARGKLVSRQLGRFLWKIPGNIFREGFYYDVHGREMQTYLFT